MSTEMNVTLVRRAVADIWNGLDLDLADTLFGPAYINHGGLIPDLVIGPESVKIAVALHHTAFPHLHVREKDLVAEDDLVELEWAANNSSESWDVSCPTTGLIASGTTLVLCANDRITESWTVWRGAVSGEVAAAGRRPAPCQGERHRFAG